MKDLVGGGRPGLGLNVNITLRAARQRVEAKRLLSWRGPDHKRYASGAWQAVGAKRLSSWPAHGLIPPPTRAGAGDVGSPVGERTDA